MAGITFLYDEHALPERCTLTELKDYLRPYCRNEVHISETCDASICMYSLIFIA